MLVNGCNNRASYCNTCIVYETSANVELSNFLTTQVRVFTFHHLMYLNKS